MADNSIALKAIVPSFDSPFETATKGLALRALQNQDTVQRQAMADDQTQRAALQADPTMGQGYLAQLAGSGNYKGYSAGQKAQLDAAKTRAETGHLGAQTEDAHMKAVNSAFTTHRDQLNTVNTPADAAAWVSAGFKDPLTAPILNGVGDEQTAISRIPQDPAKFAEWKQQASLGASEYVKHTSVDANTKANNENAVKTTQMNNDTSVKTTGMNNATSTANVATQQAGENARSAASNKTHLLTAGLGADGEPTASADETVKAIGEYRMQPPTAQALRSPRMANIMDQVSAQYPDFDATQYGARQVAAKSFSTGKDKADIESANIGLNHLDTLKQLAAAQANGNMQLFNKIAIAFGKQTGQAAPTNLQAAITMVAPEVSKAVVGTGGGQGDRDKASAALDPNQSPQQFIGSASTMQDLLGGRLMEKERTYQRTTGRKDFRSGLLSPAAKAVLDTKSPVALPTTNDKGWVLHTDASGNKAYMSPDGSKWEEVK